MLVYYIIQQIIKVMNYWSLIIIWYGEVLSILNYWSFLIIIRLSFLPNGFSFIIILIIISKIHCYHNDLRPPSISLFILQPCFHLLQRFPLCCVLSSCHRHFHSISIIIHVRILPGMKLMKSRTQCWQFRLSPESMLITVTTPSGEWAGSLLINRGRTQRRSVNTQNFASRGPPKEEEEGVGWVLLDKTVCPSFADNGVTHDLESFVPFVRIYIKARCRLLVKFK